MTRWMAATIAACLVLACAPLLVAQGSRASEASTELGIVVGVGQSIRRDLSASPLDFSGNGSDAALTARHVVGRSAIEFSLNGGRRSLRSSSSASLASERITQGQFALSLLRPLGDDRECACGIAIGAALASNVIVTRHAYGDPTERSSDFLYAATGIGPAAAFRAPIARGFLDARVIIPIASIVGHSYSVVNENDFAADWRLTAPNRLRAATMSLDFTSSARGRVGLMSSYRVDLLRYDDVQPVRALTHSLSVGIVTRFGTRGIAP